MYYSREGGREGGRERGVSDGKEGGRWERGRQIGGREVGE